MTRLAIPDWRGHVSPVFDTASRALVVDLENGSESGRQMTRLAGLTPAGRICRLEMLGVDTLVCGAISQGLQDLADARGIRVIALVSGPVDTVERIVAEGRPFPEACLLPGCCQPRVRLPARARPRARRTSP